MGNDMNNKPVAWLMVERESGNSYIQMSVPTRDEKVSHQPYPLYTHPAKELTLSIVDIDNLIDQFWYSDDAGFHFHYYDFAEAILRKAQEK